MYEYIEVDLDAVVGFWVDKYEPKDPSEKIIKREYFIDPMKGKIICKLLVVALEPVADKQAA